MRQNKTLLALALIAAVGCSEKETQTIISGGTIQSVNLCPSGSDSLLPFARGSGAAHDPYVICSASQLSSLTDYSAGYFVLGKDID